MSVPRAVGNAHFSLSFLRVPVLRCWGRLPAQCWFGSRSSCCQMCDVCSPTRLAAATGVCEAAWHTQSLNRSGWAFFFLKLFLAWIRSLLLLSPLPAHGRKGDVPRAQDQLPASARTLHLPGSGVLIGRPGIGDKRSFLAAREAK